MACGGSTGESWTSLYIVTQLPIGSKVHIQNAVNKLWDQQATVLAIRDNGESYVVQLDSGKQFIRGRILLRPLTQLLFLKPLQVRLLFQHCIQVNILLSPHQLYADLSVFKTGYKLQTLSLTTHNSENIFR